MSDHPDLDALSAHLDAASDLDAHLSGCGACRARLDALRAGRDAAARPVPGPSDAVRERTIAAAIAAADWLSAPGAAPPVVPAPPPALADRGPATSPTGPSRLQWWLGGSAVAAVLALVVGAMALVSHEGRDTTGTALSAGPPAAESAGAGSGSGADARASDKSAGPATGELGDVADVGALRASVAAGTATGNATSRSNSGAASVPSGDSVNASAAGSGGAATAQAATAAPVPAQVGTRVCEEQARTTRPQLGVVVYAANLRYAGTPAVVLGFAARPTDPPATLLVLAPGQGCRLLAETTPS